MASNLLRAIPNSKTDRAPRRKARSSSRDSHAPMSRKVRKNQSLAGGASGRKLRAREEGARGGKTGTEGGSRVLKMRSSIEGRKTEEEEDGKANSMENAVCRKAARKRTGLIKERTVSFQTI